MPYLADYSYVSAAALAANPNVKSYRYQIREYWENRIDTLYPAQASIMKSQLNAYLDSITVAENDYKTRMNNIYIANSLRWRWQNFFGYLVLYVLYVHCMEFPTLTSLIPTAPGMMVPLNTNEPLKQDDLRSFSVAWRYKWQGDGMTSYPWFSLSAGTVTPIQTYVYSGLSNPPNEISGMASAFANSAPTYSGRLSNLTGYPIGTHTGGGDPDDFAQYSDLDLLTRTDYDKFCSVAALPSQPVSPSTGFVDRMYRDFMNSSLANDVSSVNYRFRTGKAIMSYLASGSNVKVLQSPNEWMMENGGTDLMDYFGWSDIGASQAYTLPEDPDDVTPPDPGEGAGFGVRFGEEFA